MISAASLTAALATPALALTGTGDGTGSTRLGAHGAAVEDLISSYSDCSNITTVYDTFIGNGTWEAEVAANCTGFR
jgi:hypothetical protein